jgi:hypothetical protein
MSDPILPGGSSIDHRRRSVSVPRHLMPVLLALHAGERSGSVAEVTELRAAGLMQAQRLDPLLITLISVMTDPALVVTVEAADAGKPRLATIWGTPRRAVIGMTDDSRQFELIQIEPGLLPFHLAQATGLAPLPRQPYAGGFSLPASAMDSAEDLLARDPVSAGRVLLRAGVPTLWADRLLSALALRRSIWTVESVWLSTGRRRSEARLSILDAGSAGYWRLSEANSDGRIRAEVSSFDDIMHRFVDLLPGGSSTIDL